MPAAQLQRKQHELLTQAAGKVEQQPTPSELLISAAVSGLVTKTACAPMDRLRLLYQIQGMLQQRHKQQQTHTAEPHTLIGAPKGPYKGKYRGVTDALRLVVREEGLLGLWKGNGVNAMRAAACYAIKFPTNDMAKRVIGNNSGSSSNMSNRISCLGSLLLAGAIAGTLQKTFSYPLDFVSVRIALGINVSALGHPEVFSGVPSNSTTSNGYEGLMDCLRRVWRLEGARGFFKGYSIAIWSGVPYVMLQMTCFDLAKTKIGDAAERRRSGGSWPMVLLTAGISDLTFIQILENPLGSLWTGTPYFYGSVANMTAQAVVFPFDTIRKRIMNDGIDGRPHLYSSTWGCFNAIRRTEGLRALYYGIWPATLRSVPAGAIQFACYELMKELFLAQKLS